MATDPRRASPGRCAAVNDNRDITGRIAECEARILAREQVIEWLAARGRPLEKAFAGLARLEAELTLLRRLHFAALPEAEAL